MVVAEVCVVVLSDGLFGLKLGSEATGCKTGIRHRWSTSFRDGQRTRLVCPGCIHTQQVSGINYICSMCWLKESRFCDGLRARSPIPVRVYRFWARIHTPRIRSHFTSEVIIVHLVLDRI